MPKIHGSSRKAANERNEVMEIEGNTKVKCKHCNNEISNKIERIKAHLNKCSKIEKSRNISEAPSESDCSEGQADTSHTSDTSLGSINLDKDVQASTSTSASSVQSWLGKSTIKVQRKLSEYVLTTSNAQKEDIDKKIARFFYANNIAFFCAESKHFLEMIEVLRPGYSPPSRKILAGSLLGTINDEIESALRSQITDQTCINSGPSLVADLTKVFLNFRLKPYASSSDIENTFLGIRLSEQDKDSTRFLWLHDPKNPHSPIVTYRFKSVLFGATCSPFLLAACLKHHVESSNTRFPHLLRNQVYVDNVYGTFESEEEMRQFFIETVDLFKTACLNLREWLSNSSFVNQFFNQHNPEPIIKILGLNWDTIEDVIYYPPKAAIETANTK